VPRYEGRLELTWTNKHERLLAHDDGSYEWLPPSDYRVAEVRLLNNVETVGDVSKRRAEDNLLICGDALHALTSLTKLPEFKSEYLGKVKLVYIDPPFNTGQLFPHYDDALEHSVWLTMLRDRLLQIRDLLAPDGSVWVHLDDVEGHRARAVLDEVLTTDCFVGEVIWEKTDARKMDAQAFSSAHDRILVYSRNSDFRLNRHQVNARKKDFPHVDSEGRRYSRRELRKWGKNSLRKDRPTMGYGIEAPDGSVVYPIRPDGEEGCWRWHRPTYEANLDRIDWVDRIGQLEPYVKTYHEVGKSPLPSKSVWRVEEFGGNPAAREESKALFPGLEPFATPKPEGLIGEIIFLSSQPGDIVLDCFAGSGTTAAVAHKMGRRWVTVERSSETVETFTLPRLHKVVAGEDAGGISIAEVPAGEGLPESVKPGEPKVAAKVLNALAEAGTFEEVDGLDRDLVRTLVRVLRTADKTTKTTLWHGGGGFRVLDVAPSMFEADQGLVFLGDWMTNGVLAEATAAQLGFNLESVPPFVGRKGRTRLAVIDGVVNETVVRMLTSALTDDERVVVCGTGIDPDARQVLRALRPGSTLRKIPAALLDRYRSPRLTRTVAGNDSRLARVES